jgi:hypothetical protein
VRVVKACLGISEGLPPPSSMTCNRKAVSPFASKRLYPLEGRPARRLRRRSIVCRHSAASGAFPGDQFFVIVPPEYRSLGAPPVEWWIDDFMGHLGLPYYLGLLTAALWHGSSHFAVMETQVVASVNRRPVMVGRTRVRFFASAKIAATPVEKRTNVWGGVRVSTPAATLLDLIQYRLGGGWSGQAAADLFPRITADDLLAALDAAGSVPSAQRLGFVFERVGADELANVAARWIDGKPRRAIDLEPGAGAAWEHSGRWQVRVNSRLDAIA